MSSAAIVALAAPTAMAKLELKLGGYYSGAIAFTDHPTDDRDYKLGSDSEIYVKGKQVLDNGLEIGFKAEFELEDDGDNGPGEDTVDEVYIYFKGAFGKVEFGQNDGIGDTFRVETPRALQEHAVNDSDLDPLKITDIQTTNETSDDYTKITYMTPSFSGLRFGVSLTPEAEKNNKGFTSAGKDAGDEIFEIGLAYTGEFNDIELDFTTTYVTADDGGGLDNNEWNVGLGVACGPWEFAGNYRDSEGDGLKGFGNKHDEYQAWSAGIGYKVGQWKFTGEYGQEEGETSLGVQTKDGRAAMFAGRYEITKGVRIGAGFLWQEDDVSGEDGSAFIIETALKF
jgi:predicted porin